MNIYCNVLIYFLFMLFQVKPEDVPLDLRAHDVSTHSMTLSWSPPIRLNPVNYKVIITEGKNCISFICIAFLHILCFFF